MELATDILVSQSLAMANVLIALAAAVGLVVAALTYQKLGPDHLAARPMGWVIAGLAAIAAGAIAGGYGYFISMYTRPDTTQLIQGALTAIGLVCIAVYFYRVGKDAEPAADTP